MTETVAEFATATASVNLKALEAKAAAVVKDIEIVLSDATVLESVLPPEVRAILAEAQAVLSVIQKILADI